MRPGTEPHIDEQLVRRLLDEQFPRWADLPLAGVPEGGVDNRTFRLGEHLLVRLPSARRYAAAVAKEQCWLPVLAPQLPLPIPSAVAVGRPGPGYPYPWSVYGWIDGQTAAPSTVTDLVGLAVDLAGFLTALQGVDASNGPAPGSHNFHRGASLEVYRDETLAAAGALGARVDRAEVLEVWERAVSSTWTGKPVWFHGDVAAGNLLVREGRLAAVIDFGTSGVGDPACDLVIAWTLLDPPARAAFRNALDPDEATWARGRGWALWKALITLVDVGDDAPAAALPGRVVHQVLADLR